jgi:hypothetical protein
MTERARWLRSVAGRVDRSPYAVPSDEPAVRCPHCDRPFRRERFRDLHVGESHASACTDAERAAYDAASDDEADALFRYQLKLVAGLIVLSFGFVYVYAAVLGA